MLTEYFLWPVSQCVLFVCRRRFRQVIDVVKKYRGDHARLAQKLVDKAVTEINMDDISAVVVVFTEDAVAFGRRNHHK